MARSFVPPASRTALAQVLRMKERMDRMKAARSSGECEED